MKVLHSQEESAKVVIVSKEHSMKLKDFGRNDAIKLLQQVCKMLLENASQVQIFVSS